MVFVHCIKDNISSLLHGSLLPRASMTLEVPPFRILPKSIEINVSAVFRHVQKQSYAGTSHGNEHLSFILRTCDLVVVYFVNTFCPSSVYSTYVQYMITGKSNAGRVSIPRNSVLCLEGAERRCHLDVLGESRWGLWLRKARGRCPSGGRRSHPIRDRCSAQSPIKRQRRLNIGHTASEPVPSTSWGIQLFLQVPLSYVKLRPSLPHTESGMLRRSWWPGHIFLAIIWNHHFLLDPFRRNVPPHLRSCINYNWTLRLSACFLYLVTACLIRAEEQVFL